MKKSIYRTLTLVIGALLVSALASSCAEDYDKYPPKYERQSDYILPESETPTDQERQTANDIITEYLDTYPTD